MTILEIIQDFCRRTGLKVPAILFSSQDTQILQLVGLANELMEDLSITRKKWTALERECTFTSLAAELQGDLRTLAPGILWMIQGSFYDRTSRLPIKGPLTPAQWQASKAVSYSSAYSNFRLTENKLMLYPAPAAGHSMAFSYKSYYLVKDNDLNTFKQYFTKDSDTLELNSAILLRGLRWLWKKEKGLPYAEEFAAYEQVVQQMESHDEVPAPINMSGSRGVQRVPGVFIQDSDWPLP